MAAHRQSDLLGPAAPEPRAPSSRPQDRVGPLERPLSATVLHDLALAANEADTVESAAGFVLRRVCEHGGWCLARFHQPAEDGTGASASPDLWYDDGSRDFERFKTAAAATWRQAGQGLVGRVLRTGRADWIRDVGSPHRPEAAALGIRAAIACPVLAGRDVVGVLEFYSGVVVDPEPGLLQVLAGAGTQLGRVVERQRARRQLTEAIRREQRRLGEDLHDSLGQELAGLGMIARSLEDRLRAENRAEAGQAAEIVRGLQTAAGQVRDLARGLFLGEVGPEGLTSALEGLVARTQHRSGLACSFRCDRPVVVRDNDTATQLFGIAQEAVVNAAKHAQAGRIAVLLEASAACLRLVVRDDGVGIPDGRGPGLGLRIMRARAELIGARLDVVPAAGGGIAVICTINGDRHHDPAQNENRA